MPNANFPQLDKMLNKMGVDTLSELSTLDPIPLDGLDVSAKDLSNYLRYDPETGAIKFRDEAFEHAPVLYIKSPSRDKATFSQPKFHLLWCQTLENMFNTKRFNRYVLVPATGRVLEHYFMLNNFIRGDHESQLDICQNCLKVLRHSWNINKTVGTFKLPDVLEEYQPQLKQKPASEFLIPRKGGYPPNWKHISNRYREQQNWVCENCHVSLNDHKHLLHTHHIDGNAYHTNENNLSALCVVCHSEQPHHGHMKVTESERDLIAQLRIQV